MNPTTKKPADEGQTCRLIRRYERRLHPESDEAENVWRYYIQTFRRGWLGLGAAAWRDFEGPFRDAEDAQRWLAKQHTEPRRGTEEVCAYVAPFAL